MAAMKRKKFAIDDKHRADQMIIEVLIAIGQ